MRTLLSEAQLDALLFIRMAGCVSGESVRIMTLRALERRGLVSYDGRWFRLTAAGREAAPKRG